MNGVGMLVAAAMFVRLVAFTVLHIALFSMFVCVLCGWATGMTRVEYHKAMDSIFGS